VESAMSTSFIYLLVDPDEVAGRRRMYVGLTTVGMWRFQRHLDSTNSFNRGKTDDRLRSGKANDTNCCTWVRGLLAENKLPIHMVLETAPTVKHLQVLEILYIRILRLMGEDLMNMTDGGEAGSIQGSNLDRPYTDAQLRTLRKDIKDLLPRPDEEILAVYNFLQDLSRRRGGMFDPEILQYRIKFAKNSLLAEPPNRLYLVKGELSTPKDVVKTSNASVKKIATCSEGTCATKHHANGLCRKHDDARRRQLKAQAGRMAT
jgi:hypothetical protein